MAVKKKGKSQGEGASPKKKAAPGRKKKTAPGKKTRGGTRQPDLFKELKKICLGVSILLAICLTLAMVADILLNSSGFRTGKVSEKKQYKEEVRDVAPPKKIAEPNLSPPGRGEKAFPEEVVTIKKLGGLKEKPAQPIIYEIFDDRDHVKKKKPVAKSGGVPKIALIIDDIGYRKKLAMALFELNSDITFSILPFSPHGRYIAEKLNARGAELMLHLPMEPMEYPEFNPGPGVLLSSMTPDTLIAQLEKNIAAVPGISGVNNHMGSRLSADADKMNQIFTILKKKELFFIDSMTSPHTKGEAAARLFQLRFNQRDVFLDNIQTVPYITGQLQSLIKTAQKHGTAIGIGHPYKATLETLEIELPKLKGRIQIVPVSSLTAIPG